MCQNKYFGIFYIKKRQGGAYNEKMLFKIQNKCIFLWKKENK